MQRKCHKQKIMSLRNQQTEYHQKRCTEQQVEPMVEETEDKEDPAPMDPLLSGVIVKIILEEPVSDAKRFKGQVRSRPEVQYIEAEDFAQVAFVRCTDADAAKRLVEQKIWIQTEILQGKAQVEEGRNKKRQTQTRQRTRKMGKAKSADESKPEAPSSRPLIQGKGKHIRFDDADGEEAWNAPKTIYVDYVSNKIIKFSNPLACVHKIFLKIGNLFDCYGGRTTR